MNTSTASTVALPAPAEEREPAPASERRIVSRSGATASLRELDGEERIEVRDERARLLFELDPKTGRTTVFAPNGDLAFRASGDVEIVAGGSVRVRAADGLALEAGDGSNASALSLRARLATLTSRALAITAERADLGLGEVELESAVLRGAVGDAKLVLRRLETITERLFEQAKTVFRTVEDLHQLKAGRARSVVRGAYEVRAGHASIDAEAEVKIDGKSIHLG